MADDPGPHAPAPRLIEIACDESGYEGERLIGSTTAVFAHASVRLDRRAAAACMEELRRRIRSPATEYKANHLLREKHRGALEWLLGPQAPVLGHANVLLIDKAYYVIRHLARLLEPEWGAKESADALYRDGPRTLGARRWCAFLASANDLLRSKHLADPTTTVDNLVALAEALGDGHHSGPIAGVRAALGDARARAGAGRARLLVVPRDALDPILPAIAHAVRHWHREGARVWLVHDQQNALSVARIRHLTATLGDALAQLVLVDSNSDPRVQVADMIAGIARKIASDELNGGGDPRLAALVRPYVAATSIWGDASSWSRLAGSAPADRTSALHCTLCESGDEAVQEQVEHEGDRDRDEHGGGLQRLPEEDVAADQLRRHPGGDDLLRRG